MGFQQDEATPPAHHITVSPPDNRYIVWFDIDNTLYSSNAKIAEAMGERIQAYFDSMGIGHLHQHYYLTYGLTVRGLLLHHQVDPLDFERKCTSFPLEAMLKPSPSVRKLLEDIDRKKARVWALTNGSQTHAERVLRALHLGDLMEGLVYSDYTEPDFSCKPERAFYEKALKQANVTDPSKCFFIDDSRQNVEAALNFGWGRCVHYAEPIFNEESDVESPKPLILVTTPAKRSGSVEVVTDLEQLRTVWSDIFKS